MATCSLKECTDDRDTSQHVSSLVGILTQVNPKSLFNLPLPIVQFVLFAISTGNSVSFSSYVLRAVTGDSHNGSWLNRGIAVVAISGKEAPPGAAHTKTRSSTVLFC